MEATRTIRCPHCDEKIKLEIYAHLSIKQKKYYVRVNAKKEEERNEEN